MQPDPRDALWLVVTQRIPVLIRQLEKLEIPEPPSNPETQR